MSDAHDPPVVFLHPPALLRVLVGDAGHVDVADGEDLLLSNRRGRLVVTLVSRKEKHHVIDAEVTRTAWLGFQVAQVERAEELRIEGEPAAPAAPAPAVTVPDVGAPRTSAKKRRARKATT